MPTPSTKDMLTIHANVQITAFTLQAIVGHAKRLAGRTAQGTFHVDTAEYVSAMITRFLEEKDFEAYACQEENYPLQPPSETDKK